MSWTLCTSGAAIAKAGANAGTAASSAALLQAWSDEAEGSICMKIRKDVVTNYAGVPTLIQNCLADLASDLIAMKIINYSLNSYTRAEAQTMLNVLKDNSDMIIKDLREKQYQEFS